jgi:hypothetical protein
MAAKILFGGGTVERHAIITNRKTHQKPRIGGPFNGPRSPRTRTKLPPSDWEIP